MYIYIYLGVKWCETHFVPFEALGSKVLLITHHVRMRGCLLFLFLLEPN